jgi:hypothetical protein
MPMVRYLILVFAIILTSCHSRYLSLNYDVYYGPVWNNDHSCIAFVASKVAYRSAEGFSKFPDGGIPDYLLRDVSLYTLCNENNRLTQILGFNDLEAILGPSRSNWTAKIAFTDSVIYFNLSPVMSWDHYINGAKSGTDYLPLTSLRDKYSISYSININNKKVLEADSMNFRKIYEKCVADNLADLTRLNIKLSAVPLDRWGLIVKEIYPKSDKDYIEETIYLYNNSALTRRAVAEQIIKKMSKQQISGLLKMMEDYKNNLKGLEKTEYEIYSEDIYSIIHSFLD